MKKKDINKSLLDEKMKRFIESIDDEIVKKVSFLPILSGGFGYKTYVLEKTENGNILLSVKKSVIVFMALYMVIFYFIVGIIAYIERNEYVPYFHISWGIVFLISALFGTIVYGVHFYSRLQTKIFDFSNNCFYEKRYFSKLSQQNINNSSKIIPFDKIHALQITCENIKSEHGDFLYISYELNIILKDSSRYPLIDFSNIDDIRRIADEIAKKLEIKVWDLSAFI